MRTRLVHVPGTVVAPDVATGMKKMTIRYFSRQMIEYVGIIITLIAAIVFAVVTWCLYRPS